ncbi:DNA-binding transcriptional LysR family regulator [Saccharothrix tamanrassetensis]|uniref:DNA-binding transcriptional LysR family regulator n=1 Tax=Saccharothrix tamanrassetensis TaxID=1051531 RepID=A0A841CPX6_9PSEU|nr:LysR family transcriptional regulator [Saccharothrix tamanrassetensis]MBB5960462.1 DNA-binding transcriptional LysR family regulator [Saccharothrix tamanrassetensis]
MDERRLASFVVLAQELNFTRAARRLHMTQSTLSAAMKALEAELGVELFARSTRSVNLTEAGWAFLPRARDAIEAIDAARAAVEPGGELRGQLVVGMLQGLTMVDLPALAGDFHRRHPQVRLHLETSRRGTAGLVEDIRHGRIDVAFAGTSIEDARLRVVPLRSYTLHLVVPPEHPLADRDAVTMRDIAEETFIDMPPGFGQRAVVDEAFARHAQTRTVLVEVTDLTTIPAYVAQGLGVAVLPAELATSAATPLTAIPIADEAPTWTLGIVLSAVRPPPRAVHAFLDQVQHHIRPDRAF